ncbi:MAG: FAD-linked oxidase C-terminal domain-containing protein [Bacteroidota bacterium]
MTAPLPIPVNFSRKFEILRASLDGEIYADKMMRTLYATDASVYREMPLAVAFPKHKDDIRQLVYFANKEKLPLIPRAAGTSLAGQCVGRGIVVDVSKYMNQILEINGEEGWAKVQPGVIRDELNHHARSEGLFFGPNTSTANRAMIAGMVGNNSSGSYSIVYGTTRDHVMEVEAILSDGSMVTFKSVNREEFEEKCKLHTLEGKLYRHAVEILARPDNQAEIRKEFPKSSIHRRNTGYAIDILLESNRFTPGGEDFDFCKLIAGSEGTLCFITEIKVHMDPLPPKVTMLQCAHFESVQEALKAVVTAMPHEPRAVELMDRIVMDCTKENAMYRDYRFFLNGEPEAVLIIEFGGETEAEASAKIDALEADFKAQELGYDYPRVYGNDIKKVWNLRKAGLGLLANVPGDAKPVAVIEDTAVTVEELPAYIEEFTAMMDKHGQQAVYYAHAGAGELHLRPILDLKKTKDRKLFRDIGHDTAKLVKKYQGSLSGEHGDGRVRAEFIPLMIGKKNYRLIEGLKATWDPNNLFNPGKIVDAPPMDTSLRYEAEQETPQFETMFDFSSTDGILRAAEKCNGSGDCRKIEISGGTMCPSYMATRSEKDTTRARANILREFLTRSDKANRFDHKEIYEVMDLCLSCKGCSSECPSNVDVSTLKAEFLHQYYQANGVPFRSRVFANFNKLVGLGAIAPGLTNFFLKNSTTSGIMKQIIGIAPKRSMPLLQKMTLRRWFKKYHKSLYVDGPVKGQVQFFCDEFTNLNDTHIGIKAIQLLYRLGYEVEMVNHPESGRAAFSKGMLPLAKKFAEENVRIFQDLVTEDTPLLAVEPSTILGFRDEYPRIVGKELVDAAKRIAPHALMVEEFLIREIKAGNITADSFTEESRKIKLHGHCHQKSVSSAQPSVESLSLPKNYEVELIPSGCCGMAGSFGYEKEHFDISMKVGELVLFPAVRSAEKGTIIAAPGTSCRHQIHDGTGKRAFHPVEVLHAALKG